VGRYIVRRVLYALPVLFLVSLVVFVLAWQALGDPVVLMLGQDADPQTIARLREDLGFNRPVAVQYLDWLGHLVRGDLGRSFRLPYGVVDLILARLPVTLQLAAQALLLAICVAIPLGIMAALHHNRGLDLVSSTLAVLGVSMPNFWLGILLILVFALTLRWLPSSGYVSPLEDPLGNLRLMILPTVTLAAAYAGTLTRIARSSMLEVLGREYVTTARSKGLRESRVLVGHCLRNALIPVVTVVGVEFGRLLGGAVVTETIFGLPGVGRLVIDAILGRDYSVVQGVVLFMTAAAVLSSLIVDVAYAYLDPRIRYG
jgi:peptide/nickel transport system permease protein